MVKREDVFLAVDSYASVEKGIRVTRGDDAFDDAARQRLHVNWDACILWAGMFLTSESTALMFSCRLARAGVARNP